MNKTLISVLLAAAALFTVSCSDDDTPEVPQITDITFVAQNPSFNTEILKPMWREIESIRFFSDNDSEAQSYYLSRSDKPAATAEFRYDNGGDITLWKEFAAFHGYGYGKLDNFEAKVYQTQKYIPNTIDAEEDMLISPVYKVSEIDFSQPVNLSLKRINAIVSLNVIDETSGKILTGDSIMKVTLDTKDANNNFAGSAIINFYNGTAEIADKCTYKEAVAIKNNAVKVGSADRLFISVLPVTMVKGSDVEIKINTTRHSSRHIISLEKDVELTSGSVTELTVKISDKDLTN